ncbi:hypothetical protein FACS189461_3060 [Spirochaetia bacterium]|nr:hypothetical protein FACS189461_3060 [Spirochaetia bacterium]
MPPQKTVFKAAPGILRTFGSIHQACDGHRTRLGNSLRTPGIRKIEKAVIQQRIANIKTAKDNYTEKQKKALAPH